MGQARPISICWCYGKPRGCFGRGMGEGHIQLPTVIFGGIVLMAACRRLQYKLAKKRLSRFANIRSNTGPRTSLFQSFTATATLLEPGLLEREATENLDTCLGDQHVILELDPLWRVLGAQIALDANRHAGL